MGKALQSPELSRLTDLIRSSRRTVAFTGAGISTLSGIRDFRGRNGVYLEPWHGRNVEEILSLEVFRSEPDLFYRWAEQFIYRLDDFHPAAVHRVLAAMESVGALQSVYTQNIDLLHQRAGSRRVYELHGSPARHHCLSCGAEFSYRQIAPRVMAGETPHCGCGGLIKPDIVFYGEALDAALLEQADRELAAVDLTLVLGSSLTVYPAAALPYRTLEGGGKVVIVNADPTPLDRQAELKFDDLELVFSALETEFPAGDGVAPAI